MERKIGDVFRFEGRWLKVKEQDAKKACRNCYFAAKCSRCRSFIGYCAVTSRSDNKDVIFEDITYEPDKKPQQEEQPQEQAEQPQELNLCEILKDCPEGEPFWSPMLGDVKFYDIGQSVVIVRVEMENGETWVINADGTITIGGVTSQEIMLYPSREQRDWTKVKYEKKKLLPRTWEEFCKNYPRKKGEAYSDIGSQICICEQDSEYRDKDTDKNLLPNKQAAEAHLAYKQLHQMRDAWRDGWLPDWKDDTQNKYVICSLDGEHSIRVHYTYRHFLAFQDEKRANEFLTNFRGLIEQAGDLI